MEEAKTLERINRCQFCGKTFARKSWFLRHSCAKKKKFEQNNDIVIQQAYRLYSYWMVLNKMVRGQREIKFDKFYKSPLKKKFVDLVFYIREHGLTSGYDYINWLVSRRKPEREWLSDNPNHIEMYLRHVQKDEDPETQAFRAVYEIKKWIMEKPTERTPTVFFDNLTPGGLLNLVRERKIKPWPLFAYEPISSRWLSDEIYNRDVFFKIDDIIDCGYWAEKIADDDAAVEIVTEIMDQLWSG